MGVKASGSKKNPSIGPNICDSLLQRWDDAWGSVFFVDVPTAAVILQTLLPEHFATPAGAPDYAKLARRLFPTRHLPYEPRRSADAAKGRLTAAQRREQEQSMEE